MRQFKLIIGIGRLVTLSKIVRERERERERERDIKKEREV